MKRLYKDNTEEIIRLFGEMKIEKQVELLAFLYEDLDDYHKDEFLRETDNA